MPHEKIREDNKKRVVEESARLFMEIGVEKTTIDLIAAAAGITKRSILNYFATKQDLVIAVYKYYEKEQNEGILLYVTQDDFLKLSGKEQLIKIVERAVRYAEAYGERICLMEKMQQNLMKEKVWIPEEYQMGADIILKCIENAIEKGKKDGSIRLNSFVEKSDMDILLMTVIGVLRQIAFYSTIDDEKTKQKVTELVDIVINKFNVLSQMLFGTTKND